MDYTVNKDEINYRINMNGSFTFSDNQSIRELLAEIKEANAEKYILNLDGLSEIDSAGLGMLILINEATKEKNTPFSISGANGQVSRMLEISKFSELMSIS